MSKAKAQSQKRQIQRGLFGLHKTSNGTKHQNKRLQVINIFDESAENFDERKSWLKKLPHHIGKTKYIYHDK